MRNGRAPGGLPPGARSAAKRQTHDVVRGTAGVVVRGQRQCLRATVRTTTTTKPAAHISAGQFAHPDVAPHTGHPTRLLSTIRPASRASGTRCPVPSRRTPRLNRHTTHKIMYTDIGMSEGYKCTYACLMY
jgi:hypothetical protein